MEHVAVHLPYVGHVIRGDGFDTTARNCTCRKGRTHNHEAVDAITHTDICSEAGVVNRNISTYVIVFLDRRCFVVAIYAYTFVLCTLFCVPLVPHRSTPMLCRTSQSSMLAKKCVTTQMGISYTKCRDPPFLP